jgi:hypothetical protein
MTSGGGSEMINFTELRARRQEPNTGTELNRIEFEAALADLTGVPGNIREQVYFYYYDREMDISSVIFSLYIDWNEIRPRRQITLMTDEGAHFGTIFENNYAEYDVPATYRPVTLGTADGTVVNFALNTDTNLWELTWYTSGGNRISVGASPAYTEAAFPIITYLDALMDDSQINWGATGDKIGSPGFEIYESTTVGENGLLRYTDYETLMDNIFVLVDWGPRVGIGDIGASIGNNNTLSFSTLNTTFEMTDTFRWDYNGEGVEGLHLKWIWLQNQTLSVAFNERTDQLVLDNVVNGDFLVDMKYHIPAGGTTTVTNVTGNWPVGRGLTYDIRYNLAQILATTGVRSDIPDDYTKTSIVATLDDIITRLKTAFPGQGF